MKRIAVLLFACLSIGPLWAQSDDEALVRLTVHLEAVRSEARTGRWLSGGAALGAGVLTASAGVSSALLVPVADGGAEDSWRNAQIVNAAAWGVLYGGLGLLILNLPGDAETLPDRFDRMTTDQAADRHLKRIAGEQALVTLADQGRTGRLWSAGLWTLAGGGLTAWSSVSAGGSAAPSPSANPVFYAGLSFLGAALLDLVLESTPEREFRAYRQAGFLSLSDR